MTLWWEPSTTKRKAFLCGLGCSWGPITAPCRARRRIYLETCAKYLWKQCCRRHLPWSFQALFKAWLLGDQPDILSPTTILSSCLLLDSWKRSLGRTIEHAEWSHRWLVWEEEGSSDVCPLVPFIGIVCCSCLWFSSSFWKGNETKIASMMTTGQGWNEPCGLLPEWDWGPVVSQLWN